MYNLDLVANEQERAVVAILLAHQFELSDGYGYYLPDLELDEQSKNGDDVVLYLARVAREILAQAISDPIAVTKRTTKPKLP